MSGVYECIHRIGWYLLGIAPGISQKARGYSFDCRGEEDRMPRAFDSMHYLFWNPRTILIERLSKA